MKRKKRYSIVSEKGITLVGLIIIVAVMLILAGVSIYNGTESVNSTRLKGFYTQLEIVQKRVDDIAATNESYVDDNGNIIYLMLTGKAFEDLEQEKRELLTNIIATEGGDVLAEYISNFRYFTSEEIENILGISDIDYNLFIEFENRIVIAEQGIKIDEKTYYMLESTTYFIKGNSQSNKISLDFSVELKEYVSSKHKLIVKPFSNLGDLQGKGFIKYKDISTKYWEKSKNMEIIIEDIPKYYDIMYVDANNNSIQKTYGIIKDEDEKVKIKEVIKIYTAEQLLAINQDKELDKSEYNKIYLLMNDINFKANDLEIEYWKPIGEIEFVEDLFEGNDKEIHVTYTDSEGDEYTIIYDETNNYKEKEYEFVIVPIIREEQKIADDANIIIIKNGEQIQKTGKQILKVKRGLDKIAVSASVNNISYKGTETINIEIQNPNKINYEKNEGKENSYMITLLIDYNYVTFTINTIPKDARVTINNHSIEGDGTGFFSVSNIIVGRDDISWKVSADGYVEQNGNIAISEITENISIDVKLKKMAKITIIQPTGSSLTINNIIGNCKEEGIDNNNNKYFIVEEGTKIVYSLSKEHYYSISNKEIEINKDETIVLELQPIMVTFTINPTPSEAIVIINGASTKTVTIQEGTIVNWSVSNGDGYTQQSDTEIINQDKTIEVALIACLKESESYVGYYADVDGNGSVDGIIYADLAFSCSGKWKNAGESYSYTKKENLNKYYIIKDSYSYKKYGSNPVVAPIDKVEENNRFYVLAFTNLNSSAKYHWYYSAKRMKNYETDTSVLFGKGKENTNKLLEYWQESKYGLVSAGTKEDLLGSKSLIEKVAMGWFIPSKEEWVAFGAFVEGKGLTNTNYSSYFGLGSELWSSSQFDEDEVYIAKFTWATLRTSTVTETYSARLSTTF